MNPPASAAAPKPHGAPPKAHGTAPEPPPASAPGHAVAAGEAARAAPPPGAPAHFDDRWLMALGIPAFGVSIPWLTGLYGSAPGNASGGVTPAQGLYWVGQVLFIGLAAAVWLGNRWLLFKQRQHYDWFSQPLRKLLMLVTANVLYTAPVTVAVLLLWFRIADMPLPDHRVQMVALVNVICVLFVTHAYETMFLIRERESDMLRVERLERLRAQAELAALKGQVDPHFLFNSLNTLGHLIHTDAPRGSEFCDALAEVYRYVLASRERDLVPLAEELAFVRRYQRLLELRFGDAIRIDIDPALGAQAVRVVPLALQTLVENAVKHNQTSAEAPLVIHLRPGALNVSVSNAVRPRRSRLPSAGVGLANLDERCRWLTGQALQIAHGGGVFEVAVPVAP